MRHSTARAHQGYLYRVADRVKAESSETWMFSLKSAIRHGKNEFGEEDSIVLVKAINIFFKWLNSNPPETEKLWDYISDAQDDYNNADIAQALASAAWLRSEQLKGICT